MFAAEPEDLDAGAPETRQLVLIECQLLDEEDAGGMADSGAAILKTRAVASFCTSPAGLVPNGADIVLQCIHV